MYVQDFAVIEDLASRFATLLRGVSPVDQAREVPGMTWTVEDVAKHVLSVLRRYTVDPRRASSVEALALLNADDIAHVELDLPRVADEIGDEVSAIARFAASVDPDARFEFHAGVEVSPDAAWANLVGEFFVHGDDIARASGTTFDVRDRDLEGIWRALLPAARGWLRPEAREIDESYSLEFPFGEVRVHLVEGGVATDDDSRADWRITCPSARDATLAFYRRRLVTDPELALLVSRFYDI